MSVFAQQQRKWWALLGVSIASFLGCVDFTIVNTALPALQADLGASVDALQWVINGFILALSSFMVLVGRLADLHGRKRVLFIGLTVFGLASLAAGLAGQIDTLIGARVAQGLACAVLYTASGAIVSSTFETAEQGRAFGVLFGVNGVGLAVGPVLGGLITSAFGWQWIFLINVPFVLLSLGICSFSVKESRSAETGARLDGWGALLLLIGLPSLVLVIVQGGSWGWGSPLTLALVALAVLALGAFLAVERRVAAPIIDLKLFANRRFVAGVAASFGLALFYCVAFFVMPLYLAQIRGETVQASGLLLLPTTLGVALLSPLVGRLVDRKGPALLIKTGLLLFVLSALLQAGFDGQTSLPYLLGAFVVMGLGWASILGPSTVLGISSVPQEVGSVAMGSLMTLHNVGGGVGLAVGVGLFHHFSATPLDDAQGAFLNGYRAVMGFLAVVTLLVWASVSLLLRTAPAPVPTAEEGTSRG
ncbi:DHA2 family efflux MFS transporter permease subunit [Pseudomonas protegens]|jgi:EmrB/QacA subfamily drug resistance transporter|uniref:MFS transporter n=1 Tax=Pseudomonas protegens TaxID=380021 RepID=A0ABY2VHZ1_9PSED|nr:MULTISPECIES: MFS transporter [Pseudomonas]ASE19113.1 MFS transporter [Pseudomonas protegens]MBP5114406.1 MFS transporter [Pseudomonas protegens]MCU1768984.1 MFS transporter [Pseudomonas protegens]MDF4207785.1 MFS transporter [Pseudomonas protegens]MDT9644650.1 MFS transporter [Pseudomonas sp. JV245A]